MNYKKLASQSVGLLLVVGLTALTAACDGDREVEIEDDATPPVTEEITPTPLPEGGNN